MGTYCGLVSDHLPVDRIPRAREYGRATWVYNGVAGDRPDGGMGAVFDTGAGQAGQRVVPRVDGACVQYRCGGRLRGCRTNDDV